MNLNLLGVRLRRLILEGVLWLINDLKLIK